MSVYNSITKLQTNTLPGNQTTQSAFAFLGLSVWQSSHSSCILNFQEVLTIIYSGMGQSTVYLQHICMYTYIQHTCIHTCIHTCMVTNRAWAMCFVLTARWCDGLLCPTGEGSDNFTSFFTIVTIWVTFYNEGTLFS